MSSIAFSPLRKKLGEIIERVHDNEEAITVTLADGKNVVIIPESEWESRNDTAYLLSPPENAKRLLSAKKQVEAEIERRNLYFVERGLATQHLEGHFSGSNEVGIHICRAALRPDVNSKQVHNELFDVIVLTLSQ